MPLGRSIRIYLSDGSVAGIRHGEIVNWTGQAISCPRARFPELQDWPEAKKPGVYFLFGTDDETGQEAVYIGEAEVVLDRLATHVSGKDFWAEVIAFTSKDDNLTKGHVRYLESRLVQQAVEAGRYAVKNAAYPNLPTLPRADSDAMEEFLEATRVLLGVLGHRVLEPMLSPAPPAVARATAPAPGPVPVPVPVPESSTNVAPSTPAPPATPPVTSPAIGIATNFKLSDRTLRAQATRTDEGLVVLKDSQAAATEQQSLSLSNRSIRARLVQAGVLVRDGNTLRFTRSQLFNSPSQAACVVVGYSINGRDAWRLPDGTTYGSYEERALSTVARIGTAQ